LFSYVLITEQLRENYESCTVLKSTHLIFFLLNGFSTKAERLAGWLLVSWLGVRCQISSQESSYPHELKVCLAHCTGFYYRYTIIPLLPCSWQKWSQQMYCERQIDM